MKFVIQREILLKLLQQIIGAVERRQTMPILANVLLVIDKNGKLALTSSDLEVELTVSAQLDVGSQYDVGSITVPGRKLLDICRVLPDEAVIDFYQEDNGRVIVRSGRSRYALAMLPADDFPNVDWGSEDISAEFVLQQQKLRHLIERTQFAMAQQDVRYYLNGLLLEVKGGSVVAVATDGHRLALNGIESPVTNSSYVRIIIPRKGIVELLRLLGDSEEEVSFFVSNNHVRISNEHFIFISKLIDGKFPDYEKAIPRDGDKKIVVERDTLKGALTRVAILSSDMFRGVQLQIKSGLLKMHARSQDQEEAEEELPIEYTGPDMAAGFNVNYLLDVLSTVKTDKIVLTMKDGASSTLIEEVGGTGNSLYVVMPLRL